jgi:rod shape-determining protein MreC
VDFIIRFRSIVALFCFTIFCFVSLSLQSSTFTLSVEGLCNLIVMPFQKGYHSVEQGVHMLWAGFTELSEVREDLALARKQMQKFEGAAEELQQIKNENVQLRSLLEMKPKVGFESIPALIISKDPDNWFRTIIVNRGSDDGIRVNMPVIAYNGDIKAVVGKVIEVRGSVSRILPIISPDMKAGVMLQDSRYPGLMSGYSANKALCRMDYISRSAPVKIGDMVITSGQGGIFPQGLLIGRVKELTTYKTSSFQQAIVIPIIDYNQLDQVFIIKVEQDPAVKELLKDIE